MARRWNRVFLGALSIFLTASIKHARANDSEPPVVPHHQLFQATQRLQKLYWATVYFSNDNRGKYPQKLSDLLHDDPKTDDYLLPDDRPPQGVNNVRNDLQLLASFLDSDQYPVVYNAPAPGTHIGKLPNDHVLMRTRPLPGQNWSVVLHPDGSIETLNAPAATTAPDKDSVLLRLPLATKPPSSRPANLRPALIGVWCYDLDGGEVIYDLRENGTFTQTVHLSTGKSDPINTAVATGDWKLNDRSELVMTNRTSDSSIAVVGEVETAGIVAADANTLIWSNCNRRGKLETLQLHRVLLLEPGKHDRPIVGTWLSHDSSPFVAGDGGTTLTLAESGEVAIQVLKHRRLGRWAQQGDRLAIEIDEPPTGRIAAIETLTLRNVNDSQISLSGHLVRLESTLPMVIDSPTTEQFIRVRK